MSAPLKALTMAGDLILKPTELVGPGIAMLGQSGFGKSTTVRRFVEQLWQSPLPFTIFDIEDEYYSLKEIMPNLILAGPMGNDVAPIDVRIENGQQAYKLAKMAYLEHRSVVLLLGELDEDTREEFILMYCKGLFDVAHNTLTRFPHFLIVEECQEYIPQVGADKKNPMFVMLKRIAKRGRKRGIFPVWCSQRTADVDKNVISQCQIFFLHCVTWSNDLTTYKALLPSDELDRVSSMQPGDVYFRQGKRIHRTRIALPHTKSPSVTPGAEMTTVAVHLDRVADADVLQFQVAVADNEVEGGVSAIPTAELRALQSRLPLLEYELSQTKEELTSAKMQLNEVLEATNGERDLIAENARLKSMLATVQAERNRLATEVQPIQLLKQMIREEQA